MLCGGEGNCRSGIALSMHYRLGDLTTYRLKAYERRWAPHLSPVEYGTLLPLPVGHLSLKHDLLCNKLTVNRVGRFLPVGGKNFLWKERGGKMFLLAKIVLPHILWGSLSKSGLCQKKNKKEPCYTLKVHSFPFSVSPKLSLYAQY